MKASEIGWERFPEDFKYNLSTAYIQDRKYIKQHPYVGEDGIYMPCQEYVPEGYELYNLLISKELFVEAYNKWIKGEENEAD